MKKYVWVCLAVMMLCLLTSCAKTGESTDGELTGVGVTPAMSTPSDEMPIPDFDPSTFASEKEFTDAINSGEFEGDYSIEGIEFYFKPSVIPDGASLKEIRVKDFYITLVYQLKDKPDNWDNYFTFTWYRTMKPGDLVKDLERTGEIDSMKTSGEYFWKKAAQPNGEGILDEALAVSIDVNWEQDGYAFHAAVPASFSEKDLAKYLIAEKVEIEFKS